MFAMWASSDVRCRFLEHFFLALSCFGSGGGGLASTGISASASVPELSSSRHDAWPNYADFCSSGDLGCVQTDATLLTNNSQHCWMLHVASVCTPCCMLLRKVWNQSNFSAKNPQHFYCSVIAEDERNNVRSVCTALATLLGPRKLITQVYKDLWVVSFPRCTAGTNIVGSCCICLHTTSNMHATTPNIVGRNNVGSCCVRLQAALYCVSHPVIHNSLWHRRLACTCRGSQLFSFLEVLGNNSCNPF